MIKSPLRYPGGKSKAIQQILPHIPKAFTEYREPFVGGGSIFFAVKHILGDIVRKYRLNDLNYDLYCFWRYAREDVDKLADYIQKVKSDKTDGRSLYTELTSPTLELTEFERAARFFILNRITFSGTVESGGYSQQAFEKRFTDSSISRLRKIGQCLNSVYISNEDYQYIVELPGQDVFIFLDPPYWKARKSKLYGNKGDLHTSFDHERFAQCMKACGHKWLITYDDSPIIRELFDFAEIIEWDLQYGMNNYKQGTAAKGKELMIKNY
jgi:DNA adenine methylase